MVPNKGVHLPAASRLQVTPSVRSSMAAMIRIGGALLASAALSLAGCNRDHSTSVYDLSNRDRWQPVQFETVELPQWPLTELFMGSERPAAKLISTRGELTQHGP